MLCDKDSHITHLLRKFNTHQEGILHTKTITVIMASPKRKLSYRKSFGKLNIFLFAIEFLL